MKKGAIISDCGKYRFQLWRIWDETKPLVLWIMHNPSKADHINDDPTIRRVIKFAKSWGYGGLYVGNLFPYRATKPDELKAIDDIELKCNPENYRHVQEMYNKCELRILAYGNSFNGEGFIMDWEGKGEFHYLKLTKKGFPCHPLYLNSNLLPIPIQNNT